MAYDAGLAERVRSLLEDERGVAEQEKFGGLSFLLDGKRFVGISGEDLMVRVGPERHRESLERPFVRPMDFTGKPATGYVFVGPEGTSEDPDLEYWVRLAVGFVKTLPEKTEGAGRRSVARKRLP